MKPDRGDVEWSGVNPRDPKGPAERPTALCRGETTQIGMQPRSPTGEAAPQIGDENPVHGHDAQ